MYGAPKPRQGVGKVGSHLERSTRLEVRERGNEEDILILLLKDAHILMPGYYTLHDT
jgi:hypothetical protein